MVASWSESTLKQYGSAAYKWLQYCSDKLLNPYRANINQIIEFLTKTFNATNMQYSGMNTIKSMLSSIVEPCDGIIINGHYNKGSNTDGLLKWTKSTNIKCLRHHMYACRQYQLYLLCYIFIEHIQTILSPRAPKICCISSRSENLCGEKY